MKKNILIFMIISFSIISHSSIIVKVGGYIFPPFIEMSKTGEVVGLTCDIIDGMNNIQKKYQFEFVLTSSKNRYKDMFLGKYDIIFFENILWEWSDYAVQASKVFLKGGEVYITNAEDGKNQIYFNNLDGKLLLGVSGYHYQFADFITDENYLKSNYNARMTKSHSDNILSVVNKKADIAIVTKSFILKYLHDNPEISLRILVSEKFDQEYNHTIIVKDNSSISVEEIDKILDDLKSSDIMEDILKKYGLH
ncbi:MAG: transporter substrate-binding domain-containing protein [Candidatus Muirbacterium halophilum]|nr:transporter substrate-binding domain-containing protein [Candidatus Muirbacterium halophilum]MCK9476108.1 transporter substrate-binding domain-containing protein [Candidatus Muirbacterium halophilum]